MEEGSIRKRAEEQLEHWQGIAAKHRNEAQAAESHVSLLREVLGTPKGAKALTKNESEPDTGATAVAEPSTDFSDHTLEACLVDVLKNGEKLALGEICKRVLDGGYRGSKKSIKQNVASALSRSVNSAAPKFKRVEPGVYTSI